MTDRRSFNTIYQKSDLEYHLHDYIDSDIYDWLNVCPWNYTIYTNLYPDGYAKFYNTILIFTDIPAAVELKLRFFT